jgi:4-amino-4-deoxy-L-arabinose transferase-like glycosyltransferase
MLEPAAAPRSLPPRAYLGLLALALLPRLLLVLAFLHAPIGLDDMHQYDMLARSLAAGNGYRWYGREDVALLRPYLERYYGLSIPTADVPQEGLVTTFRAPGYPLFLAGIYLLFGLEQRFAYARVIQAILSAALAPLTAVLALRLGAAPRPAFAAGAVLALYPILWLYPIGLASENTFLLLVLLGLLATLAAARRARPGASLAAGLILGAATLTRGALALFLPFAAVWLWRRAGLRHAALLTASASAVLLPWMVRNSLILGRPSFVENSAGYNLFVGYYPQGNGNFDVRASVIPLSILDDGERDRWTMQQALGFIRDDPWRAVRLIPLRFASFFGLEDRELVYFYSNDYFGPIPRPLLLLGYLVLVLPFPAIALGASLAPAFGPRPALGPALERHGRVLVVGLTAALLLAYIPILAEPRYHLPLVPALACYAAILGGTRGWKDRVIAAWRGHRRGAWMALLAAAGLIALWGIDLATDWARLSAVFAPGGHLLGLEY